MLEGFREQKTVLTGAIKELVAIAQEKGNSFAVELLSESLARLASESFTLVVMGEFKRGKSTLLNALLGARLLPTAIIPLTAIPTIIRYGTEPSAKVVFQDGRVEAVPVADIVLYVTEKENPRNVKKVREVEVFYPSPLLADGIILVDTPGVGSAYAHNTEVAYGYLPRADAVIFVISVDAPLGKGELDYLRDIRHHVHKIIFVLNKADIASESDLAEAADFTRNLLKEHLKLQDITLMPLSARTALEGKESGSTEKMAASGMAELERLVEELIRNQKGRLIISATASRALRILNELELGLDIWKRGMEESMEGLEKKIAAFQAELAHLEQEREDSIHLLYRDVDKLAERVAEDMAAFEREVFPQLAARLEEFVQETFAKHSLKETARLSQEYIKAIILEVLERKREEEKEVMQQEFARVAQRFFRRIEEIVDRLLAASAEIFQVEVHKTGYKEYILGDRYFYFHFYEHPTFIPAFEELTVTSLLPKSLLKKHILTKTRATLAELLNRNCGRVRADLVESLKEKVRNVAGELRLRADAVTFSLNNALSRALEEKRASAAEQEQARERWEKEKQRLAELRRKLEDLAAL
ncbi:dynamin family protein [Desulfovirgula thermocuniculi]|uniref:dynamin family protein n=1 Tax=Desulfovirgula thermocuniculi TaxID=348842 RepID=UPI00040BC8E0|nr:dynamin family protein [Desulfovirgula thermocuniculi]